MTTATDSELAAYEAPLLVYDGSCGFCSRSVQFILRHEGRHDLLFVPRDSELGIRLRRAYAVESIQSMLWIESGRVLTEAGAAIAAANYLGGWPSRLAALASLCPSFILNTLYRLIARNRHRLSSKKASCALLAPEQRNRFVA